MHLIGQHERPQQVIHTKHHESGSTHRRVDDSEELLPVKREDGSDNAENQRGAKGHPHWCKAMKLSNNHQEREGEKAPQLQPAQEESQSGHQHGHQPTENSHTQADARFCLCAQPGVQNRLLMVQEKRGSWAEGEARKEHHHLEAAVTLKEEPDEVRGSL